MDKVNVDALIYPVKKVNTKGNLGLLLFFSCLQAQITYIYQTLLCTNGIKWKLTNYSVNYKTCLTLTEHSGLI